MRLRSKFKITYIQLLVYAMFIAVFKPYLLPDLVQVIMRIVLLIIVVVYLITHMSIKRLFNVSMVFCAAIFVSCAVNYINGILSFQNFLNGTQYAICLYCMYTVIQYCTLRGHQEIMLDALYKITFVYCLISAISILLGGNGQINTTYFFGTKFFTSYFFILFTGFFYLRFCMCKGRNTTFKLRFIILGAISGVMIICIECGTGLIAYILLFSLGFLPVRLRKNLEKPIFLLGMVIASLLVLLIIIPILQNGIVQYIIVNLLHRDLDLTDRLRYYAKAATVFNKDNLLFGYGYASSLMRSRIGLGTNIQNGLLQYMIMYGFAGAGAFLWEVFYCARKGGCRKDNWGLYMVVYAMIAAATVEVSYNTVFFLAIFLIRWSEQGNITKNTIKNQKREKRDG